MRILEPDLSRAAIDETLRAVAFPGHAPARWAVPLLDLMQPHVAGWQLVELDEPTSSALWLPAHAGEPCHGDTMRLGEASDGCRARAGAEWLAVHADEYAAANPSCWRRISAARSDGSSALVISPFSVGDRIKPAAEAWVVVDGLHRALGWWLDGRRAFRAIVPAGLSGACGGGSPPPSPETRRNASSRPGCRPGEIPAGRS